MTLRLKTIIDQLIECETFADVGCDHGYVAEEMLKSGKCKFAYVTDVSAECLKKAESLLSESFDGKFKAIVTDGLKNVPKVDQVLIAGMGGEVICDIIENADFLPERLVLQPMKNSDKVREKVIKSGYKLIKDYTFKDKKYYDLIVCVKGKDEYSKDELIFGRDNLSQKGSAFCEIIERRIKILKRAISSMSEEDAKFAKEQINKLTEIITK